MFVPLGSCAVAWNLKQHKLRKQSLVFDWSNIKLNKLTNKYSFIKKLVSSKQTYLNQSLKDSNFKSKNALICPSGVVSEKDLINNMSKTFSKNKKRQSYWFRYIFKYFCN